MADLISKDEISQFLDNNSCDKYYIEYKKCFSNHLTQGAVALYYLGINANQLEDYRTIASVGLEPTDGQLFQIHEKGLEEKDKDDIEGLLGLQSGYYILMKHYRESLAACNDSLDELIKKELPRLLPGAFNGALHPLIHTGYGYAIGNKGMVIEGLAYSHHAYKAFEFSSGRDIKSVIGNGTREPLEVLETLRKDDALYDYMMTYESIPDTKNILCAQLQKFMILCNKGDDFLDYIAQMRIPQLDSIDSLFSWVIDQAVIVYQGTEKVNDFFLLHAVTASWSLRQLLMSGIPDESAKEMLVIFFCTFFAWYLIEGRPKVLPELIAKPDVSGTTWDEIIAKTVARASAGDMHVFKVVQVCYMQSKETKDKEMGDIYKRAALTILNNAYSR